MEQILIDTPHGPITIAQEGEAITHLYLPPHEAPAAPKSAATPLLAEARRQLWAYFAGELRDFDLPLCPRGTPFQQEVWAALQEIPYGETRTYGQIAARIGKPKASRAVGLANNRNPISIFIPCHRVIGASGKLVGYGGGLQMKAALLELEGL